MRRFCLAASLLLAIAGTAAAEGRSRTPEEMVKRLLERDANHDGQLTKAELASNLQPRFEEFDVNQDGILDRDEIAKLSRRLTERGRLPALSNDEAWKRLPGATGTPQPLPAWARMLAGPLPLTTARMIEVDAIHRSGDRLDARLRGRVRWAAADANGCFYGKAMAAADLRRAGCTDADLQTLAASAERLPLADRAAVTFARKMMRQAHAVTDDEVKQLIGLLGEERVVAIVALLAHASFQDRMFLALDVRPEPEGVLPPLAAKFNIPAPSGPAHPPAPAPRTENRRQPPDSGPPRASSTEAGRPRPEPSAARQWLAFQERLDQQRARVGRIRVPSKDEVLRRIGKEHPGLWQSDILWSRVCYGYQPELTDAWFATVAAYRQESSIDPLFQQSIFWVVTESLQCFY
jgi:alkylhydroperoxidase family enzyme